MNNKTNISSNRIPHCQSNRTSIKQRNEEKRLLVGELTVEEVLTTAKSLETTAVAAASATGIVVVRGADEATYKTSGGTGCGGDERRGQG
uniref:Uncharacterized protein n=1 Tax=Leersia perrieri TaxID=77586 RepID=A0A0D9W3T4_9ORYZ